MVISLLLLGIGVPLLVWSADQFIEGAIGLAQSVGMSSLLIGMIIIGFGTSVPELLVSVTAAFSGSPSLALGNAYGSNILNIALILGLTAVIRPVSVQSLVLKKELPILLIASLIAFAQLTDMYLSLFNAFSLMAIFACFVAWSIWQGTQVPVDNLGVEVTQALKSPPESLGRPTIRLVAGLVLLIVSSRMIVLGAVAISVSFGVSDLVIGLTIVAAGTSLPELASSIAAARKGADDLVLGNIIGSNIFNTLAVVGLSGLISPFAIPKSVLIRDLPIMIGLTVAIFIVGAGLDGKGRITRIEGALLLLSYGGYLMLLLS